MGINIETTEDGSNPVSLLSVNESNDRVLGLPGFGVDYGAREARMALAFSDAGGGTGTGTGGGGGETTSTTIGQGIDGSTDINTIIDGLNTLDGNTENLETILRSWVVGATNGSTLSVSLPDFGTQDEDGVDALTDGTIHARLKGIQQDLSGGNVRDIEIAAPNSQLAARNIFQENENGVEVYVQNKSTTPGDYIYVSAARGASVDLSITLGPLASHTFSGFEARSLISFLGSRDGIPFYAKRLLTTEPRTVVIDPDTGTDGGRG